MKATGVTEPVYASGLGDLLDEVERASAAVDDAVDLAEYYQRVRRLREACMPLVDRWAALLGYERPKPKEEP